jgi:hypothetical protein
MHDIPVGWWIGFAVFLAYILIKIEIDLYSIRGTLAALKEHFMPSHGDDDGV